MAEGLTMEEQQTTADKSVYRVLINAPIDKVWAELVKVDDVLPFFFGTVCRTPNGRIEVGGPMAMRTPNGMYTAVVGKVLEFDPPRRYSHTLMFTQYSDDPSVITYDLKEVDGGTEFTLTQTNIPVGTKSAKSMVDGAALIANTLKAVVETGKPTFGTRIILGMIRLMQPLTPKQCRSEHWTFERIDNL
ncbi:MAG: SRPBCC domain-containing protein [Pseudomonadota bacterium]